MRIFIAIEIPNRIKRDLEGIQEELKPLVPGVRWEKPEKLHITLVFLGEVEEERVRGLEVVKGIKGFKIGLSSVRIFPSEKKPRVVLMDVTEGAEQMMELQKRLAEALSEAGFEFARLKKPHVTIGRFRKGIKGVKGLEGVKGVEDIGGFRVGEVAVMKSKLHPQGAIHTPIARIPFSTKSCASRLCSRHPEQRRGAAATFCERRVSVDC